MENFADWPTLAEVTARTGISERTLARKIKDGVLRREYRPIPGRKPLPVISPEDVAALSEKTLKPSPAPAPAQSVAPVSKARIPDVLHTDILPQLKDMAESVARSLATELAERLTLNQKYYLTIKEAVQVSGLPGSYLRRKIKDSALPAYRLGNGWRIRREDLATHAVSAP
jgi:excisionase family DNA binding protein